MDVAKWAREWEKLARRYPPPILSLPVRFSLHVRGAQWRLEGKQLTARPSGILRRPVDAWDMRREFRATAGDDERLLIFLSRYGWWSEHYPRRVRDYHELRKDIDDILLMPPRRRTTRVFLATRLLKKDFTLKFRWERRMPAPEVEANGIYDALCLTVQIDLLREVEYRKCMRPDCNEIFEVTSRHHRDYHTQYCAHLESVRKGRRPAN